MRIVSELRGKRFRTRAVDSCLVGRHPVRDPGDPQRRPGPVGTFTVPCPRSPGLALGRVMDTYR